eukprot:g4336.t1
MFLKNMLSVGKSSIMIQYVEDEFHDVFISTIGIDFRNKTVEIGGKKVKLRIWDTAGQERFRTLTAQFYRGSHGILMMYDMTNRDSFDSIDKWMEQIKKNTADDNPIIILVGNKQDLREDRRVSKSEGQRLARKYKIDYMETSARTKSGVSDAFSSLAAKYVKRKVVEDEARTNARTSSGMISKEVHKVMPSKKKAGRGGQKKKKKRAKKKKTKQSEEHRPKSAVRLCASAEDLARYLKETPSKCAKSGGDGTVPFCGKMADESVGAYEEYRVKVGRKFMRSAESRRRGISPATSAPQVRWVNCRRNTRVVGRDTVLVPYSETHVPIVNRWLKNDLLRELVSAKLLTLEEEYEQQNEWEEDRTKHSFVICKRKRDVDASGGGDDLDVAAQAIGTIDLFLDDQDENVEDHECAGERKNAAKEKTAEIIVMVADRRCRRRGYAREAVHLALWFGIVVLGIRRFVAKIMDSNKASLRFFESIGFAFYEKDDDFDMTHVDMRSKDYVSKVALLTGDDKRDSVFMWLAARSGEYEYENQKGGSNSTSELCVPETTCSSATPRGSQVLPTRCALGLCLLSALRRLAKDRECGGSNYSLSRGAAELFVANVASFLRGSLSWSRLNTTYKGRVATLVPYAPWHISTYHEWMKDPYILKMTASEPLTMAQERFMQKSWNNDPTKCTFIVLHSQSLVDSPSSSSSSRQVEEEKEVDDSMGSSKRTRRRVSASSFDEEVREVMDEFEISDVDEAVEETTKQYRERGVREGVVYDLHAAAVSQRYDRRELLVNRRAAKREIAAMAGDVNLFLGPNNAAEVSVMVAEKRFRRKGLATEATLAVLRHAIWTMGITHFVAKVHEENVPSIQLFEDRLGFENFRVVEAFGEFHYKLDRPSALARVLDLTKHVLRGRYDTHLTDCE